MLPIAWLQQILNKIGANDDAAAMNTTLFAGQQAIYDAVGDVKGSPIVIAGVCDSGMSGSTTTIVCADLAGYGDDYFNNNWYMQVVKNANSIGNAPHGEVREITDYVSATGTFTCSAFSASAEEGDSVVVIHRRVSGVKYQEYTSGSGNWTVPKGVNFVDVILVGGGGGGGGANAGSTANYGGGGGGGEVVMRRRYKVAGSSTIAYSVGAGGNGGDGATPNHGSSGACTTFGTLTAYAGGGGLSGNGGAAGQGGYGGSPNIAVVVKSDNSAYDLYPGSYSGANQTATVSWGFGGSLWTRQIGGSGGTGQYVAGGYGLSVGGGGTYAPGGGGSWGDGAAGGVATGTGNNAAANSGGGGGGSHQAGSGGNGGSGYILIMWED